MSDPYIEHLKAEIEYWKAMAEPKGELFAFPSKFTAADQSSGLQDAVCRHEGMTLRDYFAAKAMQSLLAIPNYDAEIRDCDVRPDMLGSYGKNDLGYYWTSVPPRNEQRYSLVTTQRHRIVREAYEMADEMLVRRRAGVNASAGGTSTRLLEVAKTALRFVAHFRGGWSGECPASISPDDLACDLSSAIQEAL